MANQSSLTIEQLEQSIEALESRNAFQDDVIEQLNHELAVHQEEITNLKLQLKLIATRLKEAQPNMSDKQELEPPPPHY
ncbi:protein SlyX [Thalassotalea insulae]|uniref:Protein SlyX homolog n=1 Tax=Thalassotalea insulae TaxID=2056778 RepID=A0ABQ6GWC8_9GAMM|nr:SlyX family protein [Thalassotalea insulae]GLX78932.1 protein SlyX [Thalassotalea insulae]